MTATVCSHCKGAGKIKISWWKKKICFECKGSGYVNKLAIPARRPSQPVSSQDDEVSVLDFTRSDNLISPAHVFQSEAFIGRGGEFSGAGATAHWGDDSLSNSNCGSDSPSSSSSSNDSSSSSCSSDSGSSGGGD